jgi:Ca2+-binding RTX toxin-like protein
LDDDIINGGDGGDDISGNEGNDSITGDFGNDTIWGNDGLDQLFAHVGDDEITGGGGKDTIETGTGGDTVIYNDNLESNSNGWDWLKDYTPDGVGGGDIIDLSAVGFTGAGSGVDLHATPVLAAVASTEVNLTILETGIDAVVSPDWGSGAADGDVDVSIVITTDARTFLAIDADDSGQFDFDDMLIDITGSSIGSLSISDIIV